MLFSRSQRGEYCETFALRGVLSGPGIDKLQNRSIAHHAIHLQELGSYHAITLSQWEGPLNFPQRSRLLTSHQPRSTRPTELCFESNDLIYGFYML
jgi:hypothetical protein